MIDLDLTMVFARVRDEFIAITQCTVRAQNEADLFCVANSTYHFHTLTLIVGLTDKIDIKVLDIIALGAFSTQVKPPSNVLIKTP